MVDFYTYSLFDRQQYRRNLFGSSRDLDFVLCKFQVHLFITKGGDPISKTKVRRPALTPEARENQMIALAVDLAEQQLMEGSASSQVITHFLKLGSTKEKIEKDILEKQKELITAKTEAIHQTQKSDEMYKEVLQAMLTYSGQGADDD